MNNLPSIFEIKEVPFIPNFLEYFQKNWNWNPEINQEAIVHCTLSINLTGKHLFTSGMEVQVLNITKEFAYIEPTDEYILKCEKAGNYLAKDLYKVHLISLGIPINLMK